MTKQEVFDKVLAHLRAQGRKALDDKDQCMYRAPDGAKCAAGCLILDEHYIPDLEGKSAVRDEVHDALAMSGVPRTRCRSCMRSRASTTTTASMSGRRISPNSPKSTA